MRPFHSLCAAACVVLVGVSGCAYQNAEFSDVPLGEGDITGVVLGVPPGTSDGVQPLGDARVKSPGLAGVRVSTSNGRFVLRNLPEGTTPLDVSWGQDAAGNPLLRTRLDVRVNSRNGKRTSVNLGNVTLSLPGSLAGRVLGALPGDGTLVLAQGHDVAVPLDANGHFSTEGLAAGTWMVMASGPHGVSPEIPVDIVPGVEASVELQLLQASGSGSLAGLVTTPTGEAPLDGIHLRLVPRAPPDAMERDFNDVATNFSLGPVEPGIYAVVVDVPGFLPITFGAVGIPAGVKDLGRLVLTSPPAGQACVDQDGDGACALVEDGAAQCRTTCDQHPEARCGGLDCDDDGDGQADTQEWPRPDGAYCRCDVRPPTSAQQDCAGDSSRSDVDFDGVCDAYDTYPHCADPAGIACNTTTDAGVPDASVVDASLVDAAVVDAGGVTPDAAMVMVDASAVDAAQDPPDAATSSDAATAPDAAITPDAAMPVDAATPPDAAAPPDAAVPDAAMAPVLMLTTGALSQQEVCAGAPLDVGFTLSGNQGASVQLEVLVSDKLGSFAIPRGVGPFSVTQSGTLSITLPGDLAEGTAYRLKVRTADGLNVSATDNGMDLTVHALPVVDIFFNKGFGTTRSTYGVNNRTVAASFFWDLGPDATPSTSTAVEPTWTHATEGIKSVSFTATSALGCSTTVVTPNADTVLGCSTPIPNSLNVLRGTLGDVGAGSTWVCDGSSLTSGGGRSMVVVEPGGSFTYTGGGTFGVVVRAGGYYSGDTRVGVVYETGAIVPGISSVPDAVECPVLTLDESNAPANGCITPGAPAVTTALDPPSMGVTCSPSMASIGFTATSAPQADNSYLVQLSDSAGVFTAGPLVGRTPGNALSGTVALSYPSGLVAGGNYLLRMLTTNPASASTPVGPINVPALVVPNFSQDLSTVFTGDAVSFQDTTVGGHTIVSWDFGPDATPATSTASNPVVTWSTNGRKTVSLTVMDPSGCPVTVSRSAVMVVTCSPVIPANAQLVTTVGASITNGTTPVLVCGGASATIFPSSRDVFVAPGAQAAMVGSSGTLALYVPAGAALSGPSSSGATNVAVLGTGAITARMGAVQQKSCAAITMDTSALATQCPPFTPVASGISAGASDASMVCPLQTFNVPFTSAGLFGADSLVKLQLSDAAGSFAAPTVLGSKTQTATGSFQVSIPVNIPAGSGYRLRVITTNPPNQSDSPSVLTVLGAPSPSFTVGSAAVLEGTAVSVTNTSTGATSYAWTFDTGASLATSTDAAPVPISWNSPGTKAITLTATNALGCSLSTTVSTLRVFSCNPAIPAAASVITTPGVTASPTGGAAWVCNGGGLSVGGGGVSVFVEGGGSYTRSGGGSYSIFAKPGATVVGGSGGTTVIIADPAASLSNTGANTVLMCPAVTFQTANGPMPGCP